MGEDVYMALDAFLAHVCPAIPRHPLSLTFGALVFTETSLLALVGCQTFPLWSCLKIKQRMMRKTCL